MKHLVFYFLTLMTGAPLFAQVKYSVTTNRSIYQYGDTVYVSIVAHNSGGAPDTLQLTSCDVTYFVDGQNVDRIEHVPCDLVISPYIIPPHDSLDLSSFLRPFPITDTMKLGDHYIVGSITGYWTSDSIEIKILSKNQAMAEEFFPLDNGDSWEYNGEPQMGAPIFGPEIISVVKDSLVSGRIYRLVRTEFISLPDSSRSYSYSLEGYDSATGNVVQYDSGTNSSIILYKISDSLGTSWREGLLSGTIDSIYSANVFGVKREIIAVAYCDTSDTSSKVPVETARLAEGIGLINDSTAIGGHLDITGAIVGGTLMGSITPVRSVHNVQPSEFRLSQNYPNPFNPTTEINYSVPRNSFVTLKVYNVLGQEVATLFSGMRIPGQYQAAFSASRFASGVYFYRIVAQSLSGDKKSFVQVKKLLLLK